MSFTVITLNWNGIEVLPNMVKSLAEPVSRLGGSLLVFDNGSTDGSQKVVDDMWGDEKWFSLVRSEENLGFAAGANRAIAGADADIIILANSDTVFLPGSLDSLLEAARKHPHAGIIGPKLLWPDGSLQRSLRDFPFPWKLLREHLPFLRKFSAVNCSHDSERNADWLVGAVMVFRRDLFLENGGFDRDFFFYHEETELQYRLFQKGFPSFFVPSASVVHVEGASARKKFGNFTYSKYIQAKITFLRKHGYKGSVTLFRVLMGLLQVYRVTVGTIRPDIAGRDIRFTYSYCREVLKELCPCNGQDNR